MKKIKYYLLIVTLFMVISVNAENKCDKNELNRLRELARKVEFSYDYNIKKTEYEGGILVDVDNRITAVNLNPELKVLIYEDYYKDLFKEFKYNESKTSTLNGFSQGEIVTITIEAYVDNNCSGTKILSKTINIPYYNSFYDSDECTENREFEYCKNEMVKNIISNKSFYNKLEKYKNGEKNNGSNVIDENASNANNLPLIIGIIVIIFIIIIVSFNVVNKKKRKKDVL